ncbi:hypothetical protein [Paenibacillus sp.]|uniref:hypothetical protein n=1 Tax=Paenibacillus sp. TaxID=58172 RepID=UPI002810C414|nr:hypothetical protein [Paenibacillus sp.]
MEQAYVAEMMVTGKMKQLERFYVNREQRKKASDKQINMLLRVLHPLHRQKKTQPVCCPCC